ncbi:MAG: DNA-directed RNA polymerase subunit alpha [Patescibacteria group bacterium]|nr:DNA-directed RNA polymerase subunit alpha [Patescibacteria group bacterium]
METTYLSDNVKIKRIEEDETKGSFSIEGLYRGYGITIGNALRRVLLSSFPGAAVTRVKIKGVSHEFSAIPGVMEDVVAICLNLKKARFKFFASEPQVLILKAKGEIKVTAGDIKGNSEVEVQNPDLHIATLTSKSAELEMELTVEKGIGYVPVESEQREKLPVGVIALDALFSPIRKVNFSVENMRVGDRTDYNRLTVEIETDGTVSPSHSLHKATNILLDHFSKIAEIDVMEAQPEEKVVSKKKAK